MESMSLLNMLAEIASEKLHSDPTVRRITKVEEKSSALCTPPTNQFQQNRGKQMTLIQVSTLSENSILRLFTISQSNELKRKFYFTCRLLPNHCEETFHSFGSEDKARNLMKKHLKDHLQDLLSKFKDLESQESYILYTVEKVSRNTSSHNDGRSSMRKQNSKIDGKNRLNHEKDTSVKAFNTKSQMQQKSSVITTTAGVLPPINFIAVTSTANAKSSIKMALTESNHNTSNVEYRTITTNMFPFNKNSHEERNTTVSCNSISMNKNLNTIIPQKNRNKSKEQKVANVKHFEQNITTDGLMSQTCHTHSNIHSAAQLSQNSSLENKCITSLAVLENNANSSEPDTYTLIENPSNFESYPTNATVKEESDKMVTQIIDIKVEETIKMELFDVELQLKMANSTISHDHGYIEMEHVLNDMKVEKEEVVVSSDHKKHLQFNHDSKDPLSLPPPLPSPAPTKQKCEEDSPEPAPPDDKDIAGSLFPSEVDKRKVGLKGKGKFIGQSKDEKDLALSLIEKIKSQSVVQTENLECTICTPARVFTAPSTLLSHYKSHAGIRPYVCNLCEAVFTRQHSLNYHLLIHSNQTRFTCDDCGRKFRHPSHFKEHRRRHTGESPYECMDCLMRFKTRNTYKRHLRTRHGKKLTTQGSIHSVVGAAAASSDVKQEPDDSQDHTAQPHHTITPHDHSTQPFEQVPEQTSQSHYLQRESGQPPASDGSLSNSADLDPHSGTNGMEFQEMIPFNSQVGSVYKLAAEQPVDACLRLEDNNAEGESLGAVKLYHQMMPLQIFKDKSLESSNQCPVAEFGSSSLLEEGPISGPTCNPAYSHLLQENAAVPALPYLDPLNSFREDNRGMLLVFNDNDSVDSSTPNNTPASDFVNDGGLHASVYTNSLDDYQKLNEAVFASNVENEVDPPPMLDHSRSSDASITSSRYARPRHLVTAADLNHTEVQGSILSSLLTAGTTHKGRQTPPLVSGHARVSPSFAPPAAPAGAAASTDKWDSLMREVVSLSTAVKEKIDSSDLPPLPPPVHSITLTKTPAPPPPPPSSPQTTPMKELSTNAQLSRPVGLLNGHSRDAKEVFVLKYVPSPSPGGNRVAKVFRAKGGAASLGVLSLQHHRGAPFTSSAGDTRGPLMMSPAPSLSLKPRSNQLLHTAPSPDGLQAFN